MLKVDEKYQNCTAQSLIKLMVSLAHLGDINGLMSENLLPLIVDKLKVGIEYLDLPLQIGGLWAMVRLGNKDVELFRIIIRKIFANYDSLDLMDNYLLYQTILSLKLDKFQLNDEEIEKSISSHEVLLFEKFIAMEKKIKETIEDLELSNGGYRMTTNQAIDNIHELLLEDKIDTKSNLKCKGGIIPLVLVNKNIGIFVNSQESLLLGSKDKFGILAMKLELLEKTKEIKMIVEIDLKEYSLLGDENDTIDVIKNKRKKFLYDIVDKDTLKDIKS